jgi:hypothetical protein
MKPADTSMDPAERMAHQPPINALLGELRAGLSIFWQAADSVLRPCGVDLKALAEEDFSLKKNFFSCLFLYSFYRAGIPAPRRILYTAVLQCLRGMVTGCDNLLDDEYKKTLDTDLPANAFRFRSVIDIMVSDRVLFHLLLEDGLDHGIGREKILAAAAASIKTMTRSGIQEASEEAGITAILEPEELLRTVHHYKTGILFQCPWDIPLVLEAVTEEAVAPLMDGLYHIGMGCQIMDDMVDFRSDLERRRHNFLVALIHHGPRAEEKQRLQELFDSQAPQGQTLDPAVVFPESLTRAAETAHRFLQRGLNLLYATQHQFLVEPSILFLEERIGAAPLISVTRR